MGLFWGDENALSLDRGGHGTTECTKYAPELFTLKWCKNFTSIFLKR